MLGHHCGNVVSIEPTHYTYHIPAGRTTLLLRWINVNDFDSAPQKRNPVTQETHYVESLDQRRRRWTNVKPTLIQRIVYAG